MPIRPYLDGDGTFDPADIQAMSMALADVCEALKLNGNAKATETVAVRIIELARRGERSPTKLRDRVVAEANGWLLARVPERLRELRVRPKWGGGSIAGNPAMSQVMDYRERAAKCVELAAQVSDPICKAAFLEMARSWAHLAEQADKNSALDLTYETPPASASGRGARA